MSIDISQNELYITSLEKVFSGYITGRYIPPSKPRASDALIYILEGECIYTFSDGHSFTAKKGGILYLARDSVYSMDVCCERYAFICADLFFDRNGKSDIFAFTDNAPLERTFRRLIFLSHNKEAGVRSEMLSLIYQVYSTLTKSRAPHYTGGKSRRALDDARIYITENCTDPSLSPSTVAKRANMSETYFRALFKRAYSSSPARFIMERRVSNAKELMSLEYLSLEDIAEQSGFSSLSYFCRVFKLVTGVSPGEYRKSLH